MTRKKMNREILSDIMIGNNESGMNAEILDTEEVKSMMYHQWKNPHELPLEKKPDLKGIFNKIKHKIDLNPIEQSSNTQFLISEISELKNRNKTLNKKIAIILAVAASLIVLIAVSGILIINENQVFKKTYTENIAPEGQKSTVILPDGTKVYLNSGSVLRYDNFFGKKYRTLKLVGEAFFEVSRNEKLPFIIETGDVEVKVLGTKFNVMAYPEDDYIETIVAEGKVTVTEIHGQSSLNLLANQKATFHKSSQLLLLNDVNPELHISWKENLLTFDNENFSDVIKKLERWYGVDIQVEGTDSIMDRFTLTIKSESLREVLELISLTTDIEYSVSANQVTVSYLN